MIELLAIASIPLAVILTYIFFDIRTKRKPLSVDEVLRRVDDELELVTRIPKEILLRNNWQYRISPGFQRPNNILGVVISEKSVVDRKYQMKRNRLIVKTLDGEQPENQNFIEPISGRPY